MKGVLNGQPVMQLGFHVSFTEAHVFLLSSLFREGQFGTSLCGWGHLKMGGRENSTSC